jgi:hypothetical protein
MRGRATAAGGWLLAARAGCWLTLAVGRWATALQWGVALPHFAGLFGDRFVPET